MRVVLAGTQRLKAIIVEEGELLAQLIEAPEFDSEALKEKSIEAIQKIADATASIEAEIRNSVSQVLNNNEPNAQRIVRSAEKTIYDINENAKQAIQAIAEHTAGAIEH